MSLVGYSDCCSDYWWAADDNVWSSLEPGETICYFPKIPLKLNVGVFAPGGNEKMCELECLSSSRVGEVLQQYSEAMGIEGIMQCVQFPEGCSVPSTLENALTWQPYLETSRLCQEDITDGSTLTVLVSHEGARNEPSFYCVVQCSNNHCGSADRRDDA